jgi:RHS repeat-associated protein
VGRPASRRRLTVERRTYLAYGATENDYRPGRWKGFREDYGFTGKEEDVEVGLQYFGKRFLSPYLGRWVSADPLAVHAPGQADLNLYAYVRAQVLRATDPLGLECGKDQSCPSQTGSDEATQTDDGSNQSVAGAPAKEAPKASKPVQQPVNSFKDKVSVAILRYGPESPETAVVGGAAAGALVGAAIYFAPIAVAAGNDALLAFAVHNPATTSAAVGLTGALAENPNAQAESRAIVASVGKLANEAAPLINKALGVVDDGATAIVKWDGEFATKQLLGSSTTPGGKQINFHAADRMVNPPKGRIPMSATEIDDFADTATGIKKIKITDEGTSVTLLNFRYPGAQVAVDGNRIITVINPKGK